MPVPKFRDTSPAPIRVFHLRPEKRSRLSVRVEVYRNVSEFRRAMRLQGMEDGRPVKNTRGLLGMCSGITVRSARGRKRGLFALIQIPQPHLTMSTITHEAFHATCRWVERHGWPAIPVSGERSNITDGRAHVSREERCALVHDTICRKIVVNLNRYKLLPQ